MHLNNLNAPVLNVLKGQDNLLVSHFYIPTQNHWNFLTVLWLFIPVYSPYLTYLIFHLHNICYALPLYSVYIYNEYTDITEVTVTNIPVLLCLVIDIFVAWVSGLKERDNYRDF